MQCEADFSGDMEAIAKGYAMHLEMALKDERDLSQEHAAELSRLLKTLAELRIDDLVLREDLISGRDRRRTLEARRHQLWGILQEAEADFNSLLAVGHLTVKARRFVHLLERYRDVGSSD